MGARGLRSGMLGGRAKRWLQEEKLAQRSARGGPAWAELGWAAAPGRPSRARSSLYAPPGAVERQPTASHAMHISNRRARIKSDAAEAGGCVAIASCRHDARDSEMFTSSGGCPPEREDGRPTPDARRAAWRTRDAAAPDADHIHDGRPPALGSHEHAASESVSSCCAAPLPR